MGQYFVFFVESSILLEFLCKHSTIKWFNLTLYPNLLGAMRILTCPLLLLTTFLGFSKCEAEIFHGLIFNMVHGSGHNGDMIAHQGSGREICAN